MAVQAFKLDVQELKDEAQRHHASRVERLSRHRVFRNGRDRRRRRKDAIQIPFPAPYFVYSVTASSVVASDTRTQ